MSRFKVGDRVKIVGPRFFPGIGPVPVGSTGVIENLDLGGWSVRFDPLIPSLEGYASFCESSLEPAPRFAVGDAVRVKAGSPVWKCGFELTARYPLKSWFGGLQKISASPANSDPTQVCIGATKVDPIYLEPWNDAEEWNGTAWVKKEAAKACIVVRSKPIGYLMKTVPSTNEAFRIAEQLAAEEPGMEFVVYQEKGSRVVQKKSKAEEFAEAMQQLKQSYLYGANVTTEPSNVKVDGDEVTVKFKVHA